MRCSFHRLSILIVVVAAALAQAGLDPRGAVWADDLPAPGRHAGKEARPPNIVLIVADDLGYAELGCYGQRKISTPHLDRLASQGMRFTQFYAGNAVCAPSRCCLMTGKHPGHAYVRNNGNAPGRVKDDARDVFPGQNPIPDAEITIAELLRGRGYATGAMGKWGLGFEGSTGDPNRQGFDLFYGYLCQGDAHNHYPRFLWRNDIREAQPGNDRQLTGQTHSQDQFTAEALRFIDEHREGPFFVYMPFIIPHVSIQVPDEALAEYRGRLPEEDYEHTSYLKHPFPRAGYAAMVSHMDRAVGRIVERIDELDLGGETLILFTSDNGPTHGRVGGADSAFFESAWPLRGLKGSLYEGGILVPLVARWTGHVPAGATSDHVAAFWDLLPTLCDAAGAERPPECDGVSLIPTLLGDPDRQAQHEYLYWEFPGYGGQQAVRMGDWKAVRQNMLSRDNPDPLRIELYELASDIGETTDVSGQHPDVVAQAERIMREARVPSELFPFGPLDP